MNILTQLTKKFDYVNSNITSKNFPQPAALRAGYRLYHFDRDISSDAAIAEMKKEGYEPATLYELIEWSDLNEDDPVIGLGSSCEVDGSVHVPYLLGGISGCGLRLRWRADGWPTRCRFLAVRPSSLDTETIEDPDFLTLAIEQVKAAGYVIYKQI